MINIPAEIYDNHNMRKYTLLDRADRFGVIIGMWEREPSDEDYSSEVTLPTGQVEIVPQYFGEWVAVPQDEIDRLNEEIKAQKQRIMKAYNEEMPITAREQEILEAKRLLAELIASTKDDGIEL